MMHALVFRHREIIIIEVWHPDLDRVRALGKCERASSKKRYPGSFCTRHSRRTATFEAFEVVRDYGSRRLANGMQTLYKRGFLLTHSRPKDIANSAPYKRHGRIPLAAMERFRAASVQQAGSRALVVAVDDTALSWQAVRYTMDELYRAGEWTFAGHGLIYLAWRLAT